MNPIKTLTGIADKNTHYIFTIKKNQSFIKAFERYYFGATNKGWDWLVRESGLRMSEVKDHVEIINFPDYDMCLFFGGKSIIITIRSDSRTKLLKEKNNLLKYFSFKE